MKTSIGTVKYDAANDRSASELNHVLQRSVLPVTHAISTSSMASTNGSTNCWLEVMATAGRRATPKAAKAHKAWHKHPRIASPWPACWFGHQFFLQAKVPMKLDALLKTWYSRKSWSTWLVCLCPGVLTTCWSVPCTGRRSFGTNRTGNFRWGHWRPCPQSSLVCSGVGHGMLYRRWPLLPLAASATKLSSIQVFSHPSCFLLHKKKIVFLPEASVWLWGANSQDHRL